MEAPEAYIQFTPGLITEAGEVTDKGTEQFLRDFVDAFEVFVARHIDHGRVENRRIAQAQFLQAEFYRDAGAGVESLEHD